MKKLNLIDLHCDTFLKMMFPNEDGTFNNLKENNLHVDINKLKKVGASAQMFAAYIPVETLSEEGDRKSVV